MEQKNNFTLKEQLQGLVEKLDAYISTYHGGSVEFVDFKDGVVKVRLGGACSDCPLSPTTVKGWIEGTIRQFFPDFVTSVEQVE
jgi:Fe-S cluster biogenesis protein NfuA